MARASGTRRVGQLPPPGEPPLVRVHDLDNPDSRPRLIRLPPRQAVLFCYMQEIGVLHEPDDTYESHIIDSAAGPVCGRWWAKEEVRG